MRRLVLFLVVAVLMVLPSRAGFAQIVNIQQLAGKPVQLGASGQLALTGDWLLGNSLLLTGGGSGTLFFRTPDWVALVTAAGAYGVKGTAGQFADEPFQSKLFEHLRVRYLLAPHLSLEAFGQHEFDRWRRLKTRMVAGGGARLDVDAIGGIHIALGVAHMMQWEELLNPKGGDLAGLVLEQRLSSYAVIAASLSETASAVLVVYAQPKWSDFSDLRGLIDLALVVSINKATALRVNWALGYDTQPPIAVRGFDGTGKVSLLAGF